MALGKRKPVQQPLFVSTADLNARPHPFYVAVNRVLDAHHFDTFAEDLCVKFYDDGTRGARSSTGGRPRMPDPRPRALSALPRRPGHPVFPRPV